MTVTATDLGDLVSAGIPLIAPWLDVPNSDLKVTSWKLKSPSAGLALVALDCNIGVSSRKTSFKLAFWYAVVPLVNPSLEALANPSISPSEIKSWIVAKLLLCKVSGARYGGGAGFGPLEPLIILISSVMRPPD